MLSSDSLRKQNKTTKFFTFHKSFKITLQAETQNSFFFKFPKTFCRTKREVSHLEKKLTHQNTVQAFQISIGLISIIFSFYMFLQRCNGRKHLRDQMGFLFFQKKDN